MKKIIVLLILGFNCFGSASGQEQSTENPTKLDFNINSPSVSSFNKFGNIPVNLFVGLPNISVPIYTVTVGNHSLPITIGYHASGLKVNEISSDVGLGWALNASYMISREMKGKPDESGYVGHNDSSLILPISQGNGSTQSTIDIYKASAANIIDAQPDIFNFNIGEYSGKFVLSPNTQKIIVDQDISVSLYHDNDWHFLITDPKGIRYYFEDFSRTSTQGCGDDPGSGFYPSAWVITKIIYPDTKDSLVFNYVSEMLTISQATESKNYDYRVDAQAPPYPVKIHNCEAFATTEEKKISSIIFPNGIVSFNYNIPKLELSSASNALGSINITDNLNNIFKKIVFDYSYYNNSTTNNLMKRLRLDSIWTETPDLSIYDKYRFNYNGDVPAYQSKAQDHWGYYNGANNSSLIPGNTFKLYDGTGMSFYVPGGNREPNYDNASKGILNKIYYPTGGYTAFEYEGNNCGQACAGEINDPVFTTSTKSVSATCQASINSLYQTNSVDFTNNFNQNSEIVVITNEVNCTGDKRKFTFTDLTTNTIKAQDSHSIPSISLLAGHTYRLSVEADCGDAEQTSLDCNEHILASITYQTISNVESKNRVAGGLRVKKITDFDQYSNVGVIKTYSYVKPSETDRSSGVLMFKPKYDYIYKYVVDLNVNLPQGNGYYVPDYKEITSSCFTSEANNTAESDGYNVIYQYVKETIGGSGEGGSNLYTYSYTHNPYDENCANEFPFIPLTNYRHRNGQLLNVQTFNANNNLVKEINNSYSYVSNDSIPGWKCYYLQNYAASNGLTANQEILGGIHYSYVSEKVRLDSTTETLYSNSTALTTKIYYSYQGPNSYYPYQTATLNSDGKDHRQTVWRTSDFTLAPTTGLTGASAALRYMLDNHLNDYTMESYTQTNGKVISASAIDYLVNDLGTSKKILPSKMFRLNISNPVNDYLPMSHLIAVNQQVISKDSRFTTEKELTGYNEKGNPMTLTGLGGEQIVLLWGYKSQFPIAKIRLLTPASLNAFLNSNPSIQATFSNPTNDLSVRNAIQQIRVAFPSAMIEGYTYKPLVGVTSETDANNKTTYYEYDEFGRLVTQKDNDGNILKQNTYQIQGSE